ncbi:hypothetical protein ACFVYG_06465 [Streptomyces sp. NPDC058256]|uniref:hypothetical protein n=1 Tax=Streptomyces sp. NPDC058256 TaxID=3346408 RepID=UPI0036E89452
MSHRLGAGHDRNNAIAYVAGLSELGTRLRTWMASGLHILRRYSDSWRSALVATCAVTSLLLPARPYLIVPAVIAVVVIVRRRPQGALPTPDLFQNPASGQPPSRRL